MEAFGALLVVDRTVMWKTKPYCLCLVSHPTNQLQTQPISQTSQSSKIMMILLDVYAYNEDTVVNIDR